MTTNTAAFSRRKFLGASLATGAGLVAVDGAKTASMAKPAGQLDALDVEITRAMSIRVRYDRPRIVAGNSGYRLAGGSRSDSVLLLFGNKGCFCFCLPLSSSLFTDVGRA